MNVTELCQALEMIRAAYPDAQVTMREVPAVTVKDVTLVKRDWKDSEPFVVLTKGLAR